MLESYETVIPLVHNPKGWREDQVRITHHLSPGFDLGIDAKLQDASNWTLHNRTAEFTDGRLHDTNGAKAGVRSIVSQGDELDTSITETDYFTLRGLQEEDFKELHNRALAELEANGQTEIPFGISTHNVVLLTPDGSRNPDTACVVMIINSDDHGFAAGKLSLSYEGQLNPAVDLNPLGVPSTFETVRRTMLEEFGIGHPESPLYALSGMRLLAVCAEKQTQYTSWCHAIWVEGSREELLASYEKAPRRGDSKVLFVAPLSEIGSYAQPEIGPHIYQRDIIKGKLAAGAILASHPTVPWRVDALKE